MKVFIVGDKQSDKIGDEYMSSSDFDIEASDNCADEFIVFKFDGVGDVYVKRSDISGLIKAFGL